MSDGPQCTTCRKRVVGGNNVVRIQRQDGGAPLWAHPQCHVQAWRESDEELTVFERGRLTIHTTYGLTPETGGPST